ncbi:prepilin-type cleavage/methylation domain-containing protein [Pseudidiomarina homiensis]|uniref:Prepilin-type cleavage/methylation domain-containing protein n=2 Tax=Idiomarinaceae TaxID=267893 RepID=A0A432Y7V4_9GAMM|nr:prepilin-type cleavage/methylation domain-containing protein [Pseudidiomarina homiensis]
MSRRMQGFTFIEVLTVLAIIALATVGTLVVRDWAVGNARVSDAKNQIVTIQSGVQLWRPRNGDFTGISMASMSAIAAIPESWGDGTSINPWGGSINVDADVSDSSRYVVTVSGIGQDGEGARLARDFTEYTVDSTYSAGTLTLRFQG